MTPSSILSFGVSRRPINVRQDFPGRFILNWLNFPGGILIKKWNAFADRLKILLTTLRLEGIKHATWYPKVKNYRLCQSFQILTFARRFWAYRRRFLLTRTRFWASGIFWTLKVSFEPQGVDFALWGRLWASESQLLSASWSRSLDLRESIFGPECLLRVSGSLLIVAI